MGSCEYLARTALVFDVKKRFATIGCKRGDVSALAIVSLKMTLTFRLVSVTISQSAHTMTQCLLEALKAADCSILQALKISV